MACYVVTCLMTHVDFERAQGFEQAREGRDVSALRTSDHQMQLFNGEQLDAAAALLFGRTTYQIWAAFWPSLADDNPTRQRIDELPKYVVSRSMRRVDWMNTTIVGGDIGAEVAALKERIDGQILVYGSADL